MGGGKPKISETIPEISAVKSFYAGWINEAFKLIEEGYADRETVDDVYKLAVGSPIGILDLAKIIGFDKLKDKLNELYNEHGRESFKPSKLLEEED